MLRRLLTGYISVMLLLLATLVSAAPASAAEQGTPCAGSDSEYIRVWENTKADNSDGDDNLWLCGQYYSNLDSSPAWNLDWADCHRNGLDRQSWNDCISSITLVIPQGRRLCIYDDAGFTDLLRSYPGPYIGQRVDLSNPGDSDIVSSLKIVTGTQAACTA